VAGFTEHEARPEVRARPYVSRKPPGRPGYARTGRPPTVSRRYFGGPLSPASSGRACPRSVRNSQPEMPSLSAILRILADFWQIPSAMTRQAPPRIPFVETLGRSRNAPYDGLDLDGGRDVLEVLEVLVERDLLAVSADLGRVRLVRPEAEVPPDDVREEDRERLGRPPGGADRTGIVQLDVRGAAPALPNVDLREALEGGDEDPFGQDGEADPQRRIEPALRARAAPGIAREPPGHRDGDLLPGLGAREHADLLGDPVEVEVAEELLDPHRHVLGPGDLHEDLGIDPHRARLLGPPVRPVDLGVDRTKVLLGHGRVHGTPDDKPARRP